MSEFDFDLFVIGGGSGGVRAGRVSAQLGKRVGIAEEYRMGGTCVIRGCVPKKLLVYASQYSSSFEDARAYGWQIGETSFDWPTLIANKDREITRLEGLYESGLSNAGATIFHERAVIIDRNRIRLSSGREVTAEHILIATGAWPNLPKETPGYEHGITSNEVFDLKTLPKSVLVAGGGYIAVEFANIFHGLGVETTLIYRGNRILRGFDGDLRDQLALAMQEKGIRILYETTINKVDKLEDGSLSIDLSDGSKLETGQLVYAIGRNPKIDGLGLENAGVIAGPDGTIAVDPYSRTNIPNIWAIGDVTNRAQLTPAAIHEAMCLVETLWKDNPTSPDHETIPTAVFSQPEIGTVGLSEEQAADKYGDLDIYRAQFRPMRTSFAGRQDRMLMKLVVDTISQRVVGAHILGPEAGEMAQLLGIPIKAGLTKLDFDRTMAVHPTAAEELVTIYKASYYVRNGQRVS